MVSLMVIDRISLINPVHDAIKQGWTWSCDDEVDVCVHQCTMMQMKGELLLGFRNDSEVAFEIILGRKTKRPVIALYTNMITEVGG